MRRDRERDGEEGESVSEQQSNVTYILKRNSAFACDGDGRVVAGCQTTNERRHMYRERMKMGKLCARVWAA